MGNWLKGYDMGLMKAMKAMKVVATDGKGKTWRAMLLGQVYFEKCTRLKRTRWEERER